MNVQATDMLRSLLETSERERAALRQTLDDVLGFQRLAETVGASKDVSSLVEALATTLGRVVPWVAATVRLGDGAGPSKELFAQGMVPAASEAFRELEEDAVVRWAVESLRPARIPPMEGVDGRGWIVVPLVVQNRAVGVVGLIPSVPSDDLTEHQMEMLRLIAAQAAAALDNLGHIEDLRGNWDELQGLYGIAQMLGSSLDVDGLFRIANQAIQERWAPNAVAMELLGPQPRRFSSGAAWEDCAPLLALGSGDASVQVVGRNLSHGAELKKLGSRVAIVVPLSTTQRRHGALLVAHSDEGFAGVRKDVLQWFEAVAKLLSAALENARLYEELLAANRRMAQLQERMILSGRLAGIGQLAGGIAHEINNPLQVILGRVQILQMRCEGSENVHADLKRVESETMRIAQIVRGMQEFARQEADDAAERRPVPLSGVVDSVLELVGFRLRRHRIEVVREGFDAPVAVLGNVDELKQMVLNLCQNAIQAMPGGGTLSVQLSRRDDQAVLEVRDTGSGIPAEDIDRVFDPFFSRHPGGLGMGLAIGYSVAQRHGGTIHAVGGLVSGATLRVVLPFHDLAGKTESDNERFAAQVRSMHSRSITPG